MSNGQRCCMRTNHAGRCILDGPQIRPHASPALRTRLRERAQASARLQHECTRVHRRAPSRSRSCAATKSTSCRSGAAALAAACLRANRVALRSALLGGTLGSLSSVRFGQCVRGFGLIGEDKRVHAVRSVLGEGTPLTLEFRAAACGPQELPGGRHAAGHSADSAPPTGSWHSVRCHHAVRHWAAASASLAAAGTTRQQLAARR